MESCISDAAKPAPIIRAFRIPRDIAMRRRLPVRQRRQFGDMIANQWKEKPEVAPVSPASGSVCLHVAVGIHVVVGIVSGIVEILHVRVVSIHRIGGGGIVGRNRSLGFAIVMVLGGG
jgi:hypothetical protein